MGKIWFTSKKGRLKTKGQTLVVHREASHLKMTPTVVFISEITYRTKNLVVLDYVACYLKQVLDNIAPLKCSMRLKVKNCIATT